MKDRGIDIIYENNTGRVVAVRHGPSDLWMIDDHFRLAHFDNGVEPVIHKANGDLYLSSNKLLITDLNEEDEE